MFEYAATPAIHLFSHLNITVCDKRGFGSTDSQAPPPLHQIPTPAIVRPVLHSTPRLTPDEPETQHPNSSSSTTPTQHPDTVSPDTYEPTYLPTNTLSSPDLSSG